MREQQPPRAAVMPNLQPWRLRLLGHWPLQATARVRQPLQLSGAAIPRYSQRGKMVARPQLQEQLQRRVTRGQRPGRAIELRHFQLLP